MESVIFGAHLPNSSENTANTNTPKGPPAHWYDRIPSFLLFYFSRSSVLIYLVVFILQLTLQAPLDISVTITPLALSFITSAVVYFVGKLRKDGFIKKINETNVPVLRAGEWVPHKWSDISAGDIIKLKNNDLAPADLVVLRTPNGQPISVKTHIIDGSSQLGPRCPPELVELTFDNVIQNNSFAISDMVREIANDPTQAQSQLTSKYNFTAQLHIDGKSCNLSNIHFVERYSSVFHSGDVICGVVYAGNDCWTIKNTPYRTKFSKLEKHLNLLNLYSIALILVGALITSSFSLLFMNEDKKLPLITLFDGIDRKPLTKLQYFGKVFFNYVVLLLPISPLELYPMIDFIFTATSFALMRKYKKTSIPSVNLLDEISHVDSVITSKSMLLDNKPTLKRVYLNGKSYGKDITTKQLSQNIENDLLQNQTIMKSFYDPNLTATDETKMFFLHLSLCHSATLVGNHKKFNYISRFPDDEQLLRLAANAGFMLTGRNETDSYVLVGDETYHFKTKRIIHSSLRHPRISIIVEDSEGTLILLTRGVYKVMVNIVDDLEQLYQPQYDLYHAEGLHVECTSYKYLTPSMYQRFEERLAEFGDENIDFEFSVVDELEKHSVFLSMFGFEDKPRDGALLFLARAKAGYNNIILSSMSKGTSLVITAISLGIVKDEPVVGTIKGNIFEDVEISISYLLEEESYDILIITGSSIEFLTQSEYSKEVKNLINNTKLIILQRCDQLQASQFIEYLQKTFNQTVMAVGHSIYDSVYMSSANLSVSIAADDVQPCTVSSDIVVNSFENLCDVLFVQGVWIRERIRSLVNFIMPRNMFFGFLQLWYGLFCCFSGTPLFKESDILSTLLFFTAVPYISRSLINEKVPELKLLSSPTFFKSDNVDNLTNPRIIYSTCFTLIGSLLLVEFSGSILKDVRTPFTDTISVSQYSHTLMTAFTFGCTAFSVMQFDTWNAIQHFIVWGSQILFFTINIIVTQFEFSGQLRGATHFVFTTWPSIALICFVVFISLFLSSIKRIEKNADNSKPKVEESSSDESDNGFHDEQP